MYRHLSILIRNAHLLVRAGTRTHTIPYLVHSKPIRAAMCVCGDSNELSTFSQNDDARAFQLQCHCFMKPVQTVSRHVFFCCSARRSLTNLVDCNRCLCCADVQTGESRLQVRVWLCGEPGGHQAGRHHPILRRALLPVCHAGKKMARFHACHFYLLRTIQRQHESYNIIIDVIIFAVTVRASIHCCSYSRI